MKRLLVLSLLLYITITSNLSSQTLYNGGYIPGNFQTDWNKAGLIQNSISYAKKIFNVMDYGAVPDDNVDDYSSIIAAITDACDWPYSSIVYFPAGTYTIKNPIILQNQPYSSIDYSNIVFQGEGADNTILEFDLNDKTKNCIVIKGYGTENYSTAVNNVMKGSNIITCNDLTNYVVGDWVRLCELNFPELSNMIGQITKISNIQGNSANIIDKASKEYLSSLNLKLSKINVIENFGMENLTIERLDDNSHYDAASNIILYKVTNSWFKGVESKYTANVHMYILYCSHLEISGCHIHLARSYGTLLDGCGYGIVIGNNTSHCLIENNLFQDLRHGVTLVNGANANVIIYNSFEDHHSPEPCVLAMLNLAGNYSYSNLLEHNYSNQISLEISNSGFNGPFNAIVRNKIYNLGFLEIGIKSGIWVANAQNTAVLGCISRSATENSLPIETDGITTLSVDIFGKYNNTSQNHLYYYSRSFPSGDYKLEDISYYYSSRPYFLYSTDTWPSIGSSSDFVETPSNNIPAITRSNNSSTNKTYINELTKLMTSSGSLIQDEIWDRSHVLDDDIIIPSGINLTISSNVDLNNNCIISTGGTITISGGDIDPFICLKSGTEIKGIYPSIMTALTIAINGEKVEVGEIITLNSNITIPAGVTLKIVNNGEVNLGEYTITGNVEVEPQGKLNPYVCVKNTSSEKYFPTITQAITAVNDPMDILELNGEYELTQDVTISEFSLEIGSKSNIILNGNNLIIDWINNGLVSSLNENAIFKPNIRSYTNTFLNGFYHNISSAFSSGSLVEVRDTLISSSDLTVPSGKTLRTKDNSVMKMSSGYNLDVYGTLTANSSTFTSTSTDWEGIEFKQGSGGSVTNCTIENAEIGIFANSYSSTYPTNPTISLCEVDDCDIGIKCINSNPDIEDCWIFANTGIYCGYSDPNIEDCYIESESSTGRAIYNHHGDPVIDGNIITAPYGIYNDYCSSPTVTNNDIECSVIGLYCNAYSSPLLAGEQTHGNNYFHGDEVNYGVYTNSNSNPILGYKECGDGITLATGNNTFDFDDFTYLLYNGSGCSIHAHNNYWGTATPTQSLFYNVEYRYWHPYLTSMPFYNLSLSPENSVYDNRFELSSVLTEEVSTDKGNNEDLTIYYNESWDPETKINFLYFLYIIGEANGVADLCKDIMMENPYEPEAFMALDLMYQISNNKKIKKDISKDLLKTYLKDRDNTYGNEYLNSSAEMLLASMEGKDGINRLDKIYKKHKDTYIGKFVLHQKFVYYLNDSEDTVAARVVLNEMDEVYPNEAVTYESHILMGDEVMDPKEFYSQYHKKNSPEGIQSMPTDIAEILPEEYALNAGYPNPFNPSMTLEYALPTQSDVKCSIYNVSGSLVKEYSFSQNAGTYSIVWNASNVSSGIYLIRFTAEAEDGSESFVDYQKVTLLK